MTTLAQALKGWEAANPESPLADADFIKLYCQQPPISKLDNSISVCANCERIALSTNNIDRMVPFTGMTKLKILSLGRNLIKKVEFLESVSGTLEELWISYNQLSTLDGINCCSNLTTLYVSNNQIKQWSELDKLQGLANLRDVLFTGNPMYDEVPKEQIRIEVLKRLPQITKIDGDLVKPAERELATGVKIE